MVSEALRRFLFQRSGWESSWEMGGLNSYSYFPRPPAKTPLSFLVSPGPMAFLLATDGANLNLLAPSPKNAWPFVGKWHALE